MGVSISTMPSGTYAMPAPTDSTQRNDTLQFGRFRILKELGRGAMGVVHLAQDPVLGRKVAIKTITLPADRREREEYEARFLQEARAAGALNHPNIITVHDVGRENDVAYMALELLEGVELGKLMAQRRMPLPMVLDIGAQIAEGLAFAHHAGVVHRDIKPANIMLVRGTQVKIMDFGIARMRQSEIRTQTGVMMGSPKYMSPEQVSGEAVDHRSDIFTLGVLLYEMASGLAPFSGTDFVQLVFNIASAPHKPLNRVIPGLPDRLTAIVDRALQKDPGARYQDAAQLAADLRALKARFDTGEGPESRESMPTLVSAPMAGAGETVRTQRIPAVTPRPSQSELLSTRAQRGLPAAGHIELPHEREWRLALEAQFAETQVSEETEEEIETGWRWLVRYAVGVLLALLLGIVMGEIGLFKRTEFSSNDLSAAELARFLGFAGALALLGMAALKAAEQLRRTSSGGARLAALLTPLAALLIAAVGYRVSLIVAVPVLSSRGRATFDWAFVLAIAGAALWFGYALFRQSDRLATTLTGKFPARRAKAVCSACGSAKPGTGKLCADCGAPRLGKTATSAPAQRRSAAPGRTTPVRK